MHDEDTPLQLSDALVAAVRLSDRRAYVIARQIGVRPSQLSSWINRIAPIRPGDPRVLRLAALLGVRADDAFTPWPQVDMRRGRRAG